MLHYITLSSTTFSDQVIVFFSCFPGECNVGVRDARFFSPVDSFEEFREYSSKTKLVLILFCLLSMRSSVVIDLYLPVSLMFTLTTYIERICVLNHKLHLQAF